MVDCCEGVQTSTHRQKWVSTTTPKQQRVEVSTRCSSKHTERREVEKKRKGPTRRIDVRWSRHFCKEQCEDPVTKRYIDNRFIPEDSVQSTNPRSGFYETEERSVHDNGIVTAICEKRKEAADQIERSIAAVDRLLLSQQQTILIDP